MFPSMGIAEFLGVILASAIIIFPYWKIFRKARKSRWLSLLIIVPIVDLFALYYVRPSKNALERAFLVPGIWTSLPALPLNS